MFDSFFLCIFSGCCRYFKYIIKLSPLLLLTVLVAACATQSDRQIESLADVPAKIPAIYVDDNAILKKSGDLKNKIGYLVVEAGANRIVKKQNINKQYRPVSNINLLTSLMALEVFGAKFRFITNLWHTGTIHDDGRLEGNLYLEGKGDPFLSVAHLINMVDALKRNGVKAVTGHFFYDEPFFDPKKNRLFAETFKGITINWLIGQNTLASYQSSPALIYDFMLLDNNTRLEYALGMNKGDMKPLSGSVAQPTFKDLVRHNPTFFAAQLFQHLCEFHGITLSDPQPFPNQGTGKNARIYRHSSVMLVDMVEETLEYNDDFIAQLLMLQVGRKIARNTRDVNRAGKVLLSSLVKKIPALQEKTVMVKNELGLSIYEHISPGQMLEILKYADSKLYNGRHFFSLMPVSGYKISQQTIPIAPFAALRMWGKTGVAPFSSSLSGMFYSKQGRRYLFTIFMTDFSQRKTINVENQTTTNPNPLDKRAQAWQLKAQSVQKGLIESWIVNL